MVRARVRVRVEVRACPVTEYPCVSGGPQHALNSDIDTPETPRP